VLPYEGNLQQAMKAQVMSVRIMVTVLSFEVTIAMCRERRQSMQ
jgi:hypothetical protein